MSPRIVMKEADGMTLSSELYTPCKYLYHVTSSDGKSDERNRVFTHKGAALRYFKACTEPYKDLANSFLEGLQTQRLMRRGM